MNREMVQQRKEIGQTVAQSDTEAYQIDLNRPNEKFSGPKIIQVY